MFDSCHPWVGKILWRREWQPTPVFLPGEFHGWRNLAGYSLWGRKELDTTEQLTLLLFNFFTCKPMNHILPSSSVHGISQKEYWSGLPCPSPGDLAYPGIEPASSALAGRFFTTEPAGLHFVKWFWYNYFFILSLLLWWIILIDFFFWLIFELTLHTWSKFHLVMVYNSFYTLSN